MGSGKLHQSGPLKEQNNQGGGRSGTHVMTKRRNANPGSGNRTSGGGINRATKGKS